MGNDRVTGLNALTFWLSDQVAADDVFCHGHGLERCVEWGEFQFVGLKCLCKRKQSSPFKDELSYWVVDSSEFVAWDLLSVLQSFRYVVSGHELAKVDVIALVNWCE